MPVQPNMTWVSSGRRWVKKVGKTTVAVSCRQLCRLFPEIYENPTQAGSIKAANHWWQSQQKATTESLAWMIPSSPTSTGNPEADQHIAQVMQAEGLRQRNRLLGLPTNPKKSIKALAKLWLEHRQAEVNGGQIAAVNLANNRSHIKRFLEWVKTDDPKAITGELLAEYRKDLLNMPLSSVTKRSNFKTAIYMIRWAAGIMGAMPLPDAAREGSTALKIKAKGQDPEPWTDEQIDDLFSMVKGEDRCHYMVMLNCGVTQKELGVLKKKNVDLVNGYLTIRRSKTTDAGGVPTVKYKLWPETIRLLKEFQSDDPVLWFTSSEDGKSLDHNNKVGRHFGDTWKQELDLPMLKGLRKTSLNKLNEHPEHARLVQYFAGHAPKLMLTRFYLTDPTQAQVDSACEWLGKQWGF